MREGRPSRDHRPCGVPRRVRPWGQLLRRAPAGGLELGRRGGNGLQRRLPNRLGREPRTGRRHRARPLPGWWRGLLGLLHLLPLRHRHPGALRPGGVRGPAGGRGRRDRPRPNHPTLPVRQRHHGVRALLHRRRPLGRCGARIRRQDLALRGEAEPHRRCPLAGGEYCPSGPAGGERLERRRLRNVAGARPRPNCLAECERLPDR